MGNDKDLANALEQFKHSEPQTFIATVTAINSEDFTIKVEDSDGLDFPDVRLSSVINESPEKVILFPRVGSSVLVGQIGDDENTLFTVAFSEVERIEGLIGTTSFKIDAEGCQINRNGKNLKQVLKQGFINQNRLNQQLQAVVVSLGVTPNVPALQQIKINNEIVIADIETILT